MASAGPPHLNTALPQLPAPWYRRIPGYRSDTAWKITVATLAYVAVAVSPLLVVLVVVAAILSPASSGRTALHHSNQPEVAVVAPSPNPTPTHAAPSAKSSPSPSPSPSPTPPKPSPTPTPTPSPSPSPSPAPVLSPIPPVAPPPPPPPPPPAPDPYAAATAAGATAVCADGTWSYSQHRSGTCSGHGGVHWWTGNLGPAGPGAH